jgi:FKBP-type peptidyl-prolyl cis-trans isomerase 2
MKRMVHVQDGDTVMVHYTGKLRDGTIFDTTTNCEPMQFAIGVDQIIPLFEQALLGMAPGESKTFEISADAAYGPHYDELVLTVGLEVFSDGTKPQVGQQLEVRQPDSQSIIAMVTDVTETSATLDVNHPLAGKDLIFDIQLLDII